MKTRYIKGRKIPIELVFKFYFEAIILFILSLLIFANSVLALFGLRIPSFVILTISISSILYAIADILEYTVEYGQDVISKQKKRGYRDGVTNNDITIIENTSKKVKQEANLSLIYIPVIYGVLFYFGGDNPFIKFITGEAFGNFTALVGFSIYVLFFAIKTFRNTSKKIDGSTLKLSPRYYQKVKKVQKTAYKKHK